MEKELYSKPFMSVELFKPNEYVALCWYVKSGECYNSLYHDIYNSLGQSGHDGYYNGILHPEEDMYYNKSHSSTAHRIPSDANKWLHQEPTAISNDGYYYLGYEGKITWTGWRDVYNNNLSSTAGIYLVVDGSNTHYVKSYESAGNHS